MKLVSSLLLALALFLTAAHRGRADDELKLKVKSEYYPLEVGNTWTYKLDNSKFTLKVAKLEKVGDDVTARIEMTMNDKVMAVEHVAAKEDGLYRYDFEGKKAEPPVKFFALPPKADATWTIDSKVSGETLKGTFKMGEEKGVKVPAGTYDTFKVTSDDLDASGMKIAFTSYYAKDVGMVKQVIKAAGQETTIELEKFEPAKK
jgi:hypothetical protein